MHCRFPRIRHRVSIFLAVFLVSGFVLAAVAARPALALIDESYTTEEKTGFAFYRLSGAKVDFKQWVKNSKAYKDALPVDKIKLMGAETVRLEKGFAAYHPDEDLITLELDVEVKRLPDIGTEPDKMKHGLHVRLTDSKDNYLPLEAGDVWVALVVQNMDKHGFRTFSTPEFKAVLEKLGSSISSQSTTLGGHVKMSLRPVSVSMESPAEIAGFELWPMLGEVASFSLWNREGTVFIWGYEAPWYVSDDRKDLMDLYKD